LIGTTFERLLKIADGGLSDPRAAEKWYKEEGLSINPNKTFYSLGLQIQNVHALFAGYKKLFCKVTF
jgi:hypothetical protein